MAKWNDRTKRFPRVEDRPDYVEPSDIEETLASLESGDNDCRLDRPLSPKFIHARLLVLYEEYGDPGLPEADKKDIINRAWNLSRPTVHQVIRKFHKTLDVYPHLRDEVLCECSIVVARTFKERKYIPDRSMMTSYFFEFFVYAVLGCTSRFFKQKKKYVTIDPHILAQRISSTPLS